VQIRVQHYLGLQVWGVGEGGGGEVNRLFSHGKMYSLYLRNKYKKKQYDIEYADIIKTYVTMKYNTVLYTTEKKRKVWVRHYDY